MEMFSLNSSSMSLFLSSGLVILVLVSQLPALPYNEIMIKSFFRDWTELLIQDEPIAGVGGLYASQPASSAVVITPPTILDCQMWVEYALVSNAERKLMGKRPRDMLIDQVEHIPLVSVNPTLPMTRSDIRFNNSVSLLFFGIRNTTNTAEWSNYTAAAPIAGASGLNTYPALATDPVGYVKLQYDNQDRLSNMPSEYFSMVQPYYTAVDIPQQTGYHLYSYSLNIVSTDPKGSTNYGKLSAVQLLLSVSADVFTAGTSTGSFAAPGPNAPYGAPMAQTYEMFVYGIN